MKDIYEQYAELKKEYEALLADYKDVLEDSLLLESIEHYKLEVFPQSGSWIDGVLHDTTWRACKYTFQPEMSSYHPTVREAVEAVVKKLKNDETQ